MVIGRRLASPAYSFETRWKLGEDVGLTGTIRRIVVSTGRIRALGDELGVRGTSKNGKDSQPRVGARLWSGDKEMHDGVVSFQ